MAMIEQTKSNPTASRMPTKKPPAGGSGNSLKIGASEERQVFDALLIVDVPHFVLY